MTEAPLVKSIDSSTGSGRHTPRVCTLEEYREYVHIVKSDHGVQANGGTPNVAIESLHASAGYENAYNLQCHIAIGRRTDLNTFKNQVLY